MPRAIQNISLSFLILLTSLAVEVVLPTSSFALSEKIVSFERNQIFINGVAQPQIYGAELQYFRLRGGYGPNQSRAAVLASWNRALDLMVEAKMNAVSFYIPWDFHEYAPGKFDFKGEVDEDGDGNPDYPSRDILTFIQLIKAHGFKRIMIRPGPYINAEWGFLGFGAVPEWFHNLHPEAHMTNALGLRTRLYDYHNPDFLERTRIWFTELKKQVLPLLLDDDGLCLFIQVDNETNFQWQSIYSGDYGDRSIQSYRKFLNKEYLSIANINTAQNLNATSWDQVYPPLQPGKNLAQDQDWYRFQDWTLYSYLNKIRKIWESLDVREPNVIFTLAESFNAPLNGLLPNYKYRNARGRTGLMTMNLYPKTYPSAENVLFHQPHKSDYDVIADAAANAAYHGHEQESVIGPEIHTGWFEGTTVTDQARQQTYLTLIGRGLKASFFYYFNEGYHFQAEWAQKKIQPFYDDLKNSEPYAQSDLLPDAFWVDLQSLIGAKFLFGFDAKNVLSQDAPHLQNLHFGSPLDAHGEATAHFPLLVEIGTKIIEPYGNFLGQASSIKDPVTIVTDVTGNVKSPIPGVDSREVHSDFAGGLVGLLMQSGINPRIHHWGINEISSLRKARLILLQDTRNLDKRLISELKNYILTGGTVVSLLGDSLAEAIGAPQGRYENKFHHMWSKNELAEYSLTGLQKQRFSINRNSLGYFDLGGHPLAQSILTLAGRTLGYRFPYGKGQLIQIGAVFYDSFNNDEYPFASDLLEKRALVDDLLQNLKITPAVQVDGKTARLEVFARKTPASPDLWITIKSAQFNPTTPTIRMRENLIQTTGVYSVKDIMKGTQKVVKGLEIKAHGISVNLEGNGSTALFVHKMY